MCVQLSDVCSLLVVHLAAVAATRVQIPAQILYINLCHYLIAVRKKQVALESTFFYLFVTQPLCTDACQLTTCCYSIVRQLIQL